MIRKLSEPFVKIFSRWMPDAFIFATLLTVITYILSITVGNLSPNLAVMEWGDNFWSLLSFTAQIGMTLLTGHIVAHTQAARKLLTRFANYAKCSKSAYLLVGYTAIISCCIHWSIGLIVSALIAKEVAIVCKDRNIKIHYPLLIATAYSGFVIWHQGLSGTIPLSIATEGHFLSHLMGRIPVSETIFTTWNISVVLLIVLTMPLVMMMMKPTDAESIAISDKAIHADHLENENEALDLDEPKTPASAIENSYAINFILSVLGISYVFVHFFVNHKGLDLNIVNFAFLILGLLLTKSPIHFVKLAHNAGHTVSPVLIQFPFYAGIMAMMENSGVGQMLTDFFVSFSTAETLPFWTFISGGILNIFIPSGGGQWVVQGPIVMQAAQELGADMVKVTMGVVLGDQWTNLIQPFWAIPTLAIAGLKVRDIMGYCVIALIWSGIIFSIAMLVY